MKKRPLGFGCLLACLFLVLTYWLLTEARGAPDEDYSAFSGREVTVKGRVYKKETVSRDTGPVQVVYLRILSENAGENAICYLKENQTVPEMGAVLTLRGKLYSFEKAANPGQFDAYSYYQILNLSYRLSQAEILTKTNKYHYFSQGLYRLRVFLAGKLEECLPGQDAAVMQTMLLGEKGGMEKELKALYQRNGIAHILAISGHPHEELLERLESSNARVMLTCQKGAVTFRTDGRQVKMECFKE